MKRRTPLRLNAMVVAMMTRAMMDGPHTAHDLHELCGLAIQSIGRYILAMRRSKVVYIAQWEQDSIGRYVIPAYQIGVDAKDAQRPPRERLRKRRQRAAREAHAAMIQMTAGSIREAA